MRERSSQSSREAVTLFSLWLCLTFSDPLRLSLWPSLALSGLISGSFWFALARSQGGCSFIVSVELSEHSCMGQTPNVKLVVGFL